MCTLVSRGQPIMLDCGRNIYFEIYSLEARRYFIRLPLKVLSTWVLRYLGVSTIVWKYWWLGNPPLIEKRWKEPSFPKKKLCGIKVKKRSEKSRMYYFSRVKPAGLQGFLPPSFLPSDHSRLLAPLPIYHLWSASLLTPMTHLIITTHSHCQS